MNIRVIGIFLFWLAVFLLAMANVLFDLIRREVNSKLPPTERFSMFFVTVKTFEIVRLHNGFFPASRKPPTMYVLATLGFALFLCVAVGDFLTGKLS
jgi:hypothetical protein